MTRSAFPDFRNPLDLVVAEGDLAVSYGPALGTNTGEMMGMPPTGKKIDVPVFGMLRFRDWRAIERWGVHDTMAWSQQLGLIY
jgi:predicted ester cyclase